MTYVTEKNINFFFFFLVTKMLESELIWEEQPGPHPAYLLLSLCYNFRFTNWSTHIISCQALKELHRINTDSLYRWEIGILRETKLTCSFYRGQLSDKSSGNKRECCLWPVGYIIMMISTWKGVHRKDLTKFSHSSEVFLKHWDLRANEHNTKAQAHWSRLELGRLHFLQIPLIHTKVCMCLCVCVHACHSDCICTKANKG